MGAIARTFSLLLRALLLTQAAAQIQFTNSNYDGIIEGQPFDLTFAGDGSDVTITLKQGPATNLLTISTIVSGITTSPYTWTPATTLVPGLYALQIDQSGVTNYSPMIVISGANSVPDSSSTDMDTSTSDDSANDFPSTSVVPTTSCAMGRVVPTGYNATGGYATGGYATGAMMPSGYNMTSGVGMGGMATSAMATDGMATGGMPMGFASSTGLMAMPTDMASFEGAGSKVRVAQWVVCLVGAVVVVLW